ncbi:aminotransferase class I/II-fold pyridoxal phosphate-dependent enzyme [Paenibacillus guangzhouensis]|uniref:aminotransferase class I/II-fold pyridoxal phosphate-dependent enzyme n=1 Tax=Paenibacillus guangzhouensis TaxID=1473112 RepID=UPI001267123D|nr:aminotransferase class I/II-fold pyridoxal phosphate-dependent enzyme [Paenibacillus guangzhouensis]
MPSLNHERAPLYEALLEYRERKNRSFHVPGHKNGRVYEEQGQNGQKIRSFAHEQEVLRQLMAIDVTEITGTDDLHQPTGVIRDAQELAADCFGAEETYFLVNGSTVGNLALILTCCTEPGDVLIVQRNVHKSILHGLMLAGAHAVFVTPQLDAPSGLPTAPTVDAITEALERHPAAKGVLLCSPNYYGMGVDLQAIAEAVHAHGKQLLIDEAHGAHYGLHPDLPASALQCGADGVVQSTHKMLSSLTMSAMLHVQGDRLNGGLLKQRLAMLQSSSPSYPLMASLDVCRRWLHTRGADAFTRGLEAVSWFRSSMEQLPCYSLLPQPAQGVEGEGAYSSLDPFKLTVRDRTGRYSGYELQEKLEELGCVPEMSDVVHVVFVFTLGSTMEDAKALFHALEQIHSCYGEVGNSHISIEKKDHTNFLHHTSTLISDPVPFRLQPLAADAWETVSLEQAIHREVAEMVIPYPPGIPLLYPGEWITEEMMLFLEQLSQQGAKCQGVHDTTLKTLRVVKK